MHVCQRVQYPRIHLFAKSKRFQVCPISCARVEPFKADEPQPASGASSRSLQLFRISSRDDVIKSAVSRVTGISGFDVDSKGNVYVAYSQVLLQRGLLTTWTMSQHKYFPDRFKEATRQLLLCWGGGRAGKTASRGFGKFGEGVRKLPYSVVLQIVGKMVDDLDGWRPRTSHAEGSSN